MRALVAIFVGIIGLVVARSRFLDAERAQPAIRLADLPAPGTLTELRQLHHLEELPACAIPPVAASRDWPSHVVEGFWIRLPGHWREAPAIQTGAFGLHMDTSAVLQRESDASLIVNWTPSGALGRAYRSNPDGSTDPIAQLCEIANGSAGSIWTMYDPDPADRPRPYEAYGDVVTRGATRYRVTVSAASSAIRDTVIRMITDAAEYQ